MESNKLATLVAIHNKCSRARYLRRAGEYDEAKETLQSALDLFNEKPGLDRVNLATILDGLGSVCFCREEYDEAQSYYEGALEALEQVFHPAHASLANPLDHLARLLIIQKKYKEAKAVCKRSLEIKQATMLPQDCDTLESLRMTAIVELELENFEQAEELLKKAIRVLEPSTLGPFEEFLRLLARAYQGQGKLEEAETCYKRAIEVFMERQGQQLGLSQCEHDYAELLDELGRHREANEARAVARVAEDFTAKIDDLPDSPVYQPLSYPVTIFH